MKKEWKWGEGNGKEWNGVGVDGMDEWNGMEWDGMGEMECPWMKGEMKCTG